MGFGARDFALGANAAKPNKTEFAIGKGIENTFFEGNKNDFKKLEK